MSKKGNDYFSLIQSQTEFCVRASEMLETIFSSFDPRRVNEYRENVHRIENDADEVHHDILNKLSVEFITPIDQEDILHLVQIIDDITDALDEVMMDVYMYHVDTIPPRVVEFVKTVTKCVHALNEAAGELKNFKKPEELRKLLIRVNDIEIEADSIYTDVIHALFASDIEPKQLMGAKAIYEGLENCCDLSEHAADVIEQVIIKNT